MFEDVTSPCLKLLQSFETTLTSGVELESRTAGDLNSWAKKTRSAKAR